MSREQQTANLAFSIDYLAQFLSRQDYNAYIELAAHFQRFVQTHRHSGLEEFTEQITATHDFICRSDTSQSLRAMICGIFFGQRFILVNTCRLKFLVRRSKSGMNSWFQRLGYDVMRPSNAVIDLFRKLLPDFDQRAFQPKRWCLRIETENSKVKYESHISKHLLDNFEAERIPVRDPRPATPSPFDIRALLNRYPPSAGRAICE
jgi:hypothetical protein